MDISIADRRVETYTFHLTAADTDEKHNALAVCLVGDLVVLLLLLLLLCVCVSPSLVGTLGRCVG
jgi:hypothetical protein